MYRIFNLLVDSDLDLPELPAGNPASGTGRTLSFKLKHDPLVDNDDPGWFHEWYGDQEKTQVAIAAARVGQGYLLRFPGLADFLLDIDRSAIDCRPVDGCPDDTVRHLFLDHVVPRYLGHLGELVLHASAVDLGGGRGFAFLGRSGWGKSTLASSFGSRGARVISDDGLLLERKGEGVAGVPAYPGSRLWQDSADSVFPDFAELVRVAHYSEKKRLILHDGKAFPGDVRLQALFLLNDPQESAADGAIELRAVEGREAIMLLIRHAFLLDPEDMRAVGRQFRSAGRVIEAAPRIFSLSYPRDYERLQELGDRILGSSGLAAA